jgi:hypothetical protein
MLCWCEAPQQRYLRSKPEQLHYQQQHKPGWEALLSQSIYRPIADQILTLNTVSETWLVKSH